MKKVLIYEIRITDHGTTFLGCFEDGSTEGYSSIAYGDEQLLMMEAVTNEDPKAANEYFSDPRNRIEEVDVWSGDNLAKHLPQNCRWGIKPAPKRLPTTPRRPPKRILR